MSMVFRRFLKASFSNCCGVFNEGIWERKDDWDDWRTGVEGVWLLKEDNRSVHVLVVFPESVNISLHGHKSTNVPGLGSHFGLVACSLYS